MNRMRTLLPLNVTNNKKPLILKLTYITFLQNDENTCPQGIAVLPYIDDQCHVGK